MCIEFELLTINWGVQATPRPNLPTVFKWVKFLNEILHRSTQLCLSEFDSYELFLQYSDPWLVGQLAVFLLQIHHFVLRHKHFVLHHNALVTKSDEPGRGEPHRPFQATVHIKMFQHISNSYVVSKQFSANTWVHDTGRHDVITVYDVTKRSGDLQVGNK